MRLNQVDLNLFVVFDTIYAERNLTRAAEVLSITQPAVSNALNRLRNTLHDQLFVRTPQAMVPTPVADNIIAPVREALQLLNTSVQEGDVFDPLQASKVFNFSMNDVAESMLLPELMEHLQQVAPLTAVSSHRVNRADVATELASGLLDFAIDVPVLTDPNLHHIPLRGARYVCMVRQDHPAIGDTLTLDQYLALEHIHISGRRAGQGHIDLALNNLGYQRKIQLRTSHYLVAPQIVQRTNLALTIPLPAAPISNVKFLELPFDVPKLDWHLYWHKSADRDQASRWMRESVLALVGQ
ncbi:MAG: LysR family transcriptional regulator [Pseudomonadales bacterium]